MRPAMRRSPSVHRGQRRGRPCADRVTYARAMPRRTNVALGILLLAAFATGIASYAAGTDLALDVSIVHGVVALALLTLAPWKSVIVRRGLRRRRPERGRSLALLAAVIVALVTGLVHASGALTRVATPTTLQLHVGAAVAAVLFLGAHWRLHPQRPRRTDLGRRSALRLGGIGAVAALGWLGYEGALTASGAVGARRRFTGSHERGSGTPAEMPVTQWFDDRVQELDRRNWAVTVNGRAWGVEELVALPHEDVDATLDCTGGWYAAQRWRGVRLDRLVGIDDATRSVAVVSATGYARRLPVRDLQRAWLATHVAGRPLSPGHGAPARLVVPGRRGFWWVKWVVAIETSPRPWWWQGPFPLT